MYSLPIAIHRHLSPSSPFFAFLPLFISFDFTFLLRSFRLRAPVHLKQGSAHAIQSLFFFFYFCHFFSCLFSIFTFFFHSSPLLPSFLPSLLPSFLPHLYFLRFLFNLHALNPSPSRLRSHQWTHCLRNVLYRCLPLLHPHLGRCMHSC